MENQNKSINPIIIGIVIAIILIGAAIWYWQAQTPQIETRDEAIEAITETPTVEVPTVEEAVGGQAPELNPIDRANPFKDSYTNPFE